MIHIIINHNHYYEWPKNTITLAEARELRYPENDTDTFEMLWRDNEFDPETGEAGVSERVPDGEELSLFDGIFITLRIPV